jgi:hypothetical protein
VTAAAPHHPPIVEVRPHRLHHRLLHLQLTPRKALAIKRQVAYCYTKRIQQRQALRCSYIPLRQPHIADLIAGLAVSEAPHYAVLQPLLHAVYLRYDAAPSKHADSTKPQMLYYYPSRCKPQMLYYCPSRLLVPVLRHALLLRFACALARGTC